MKASPARLWDSDTALAGESQLSYIKVLARSAPWNARVTILPTQGDLPRRVEALGPKMPDEIPSAAVPNLLTQVSTDEESPTRSEFSWKERVLRLGDAPTENWWRGVPTSLAIAGLITILGLWIEPVIRGPNLAIFYMLAVVFSAVRWGRWAVIINAISSALLFDYFFVVPYRSFVIGDIWYLITLIGLLTVGLIVSTLMVATREEARAARRREMRVSALYSFTQSLASGNELDQILDAVARHFVAIFQRPIVVLLPAAEGLIVRFTSAELVFDEGENKSASWVFENGQEAGCGTAMFSGSRIRYRPLKAGRETVGVIGFQTKSSKDLLPPDQRELMGIFLDQTALAITRADLAKEAKRAEILQEADKLQRALLNSVSHNLRTPLASVLGVLNTILEDASLLDVPTQQSLLKTAQSEARQLDWLVQNLLDMTRLEGGAIRVKAEPCDVNDVVAAALRQLGESVRSHAILVTIAPGLPLVPMDDVLMVQVLVNLLDNALKYSPGDGPVEIQARLDAGQLEIGIFDRGRGIPEGELERVFDKFYRVAVPGAPKGTGLGLSICKGFVEAHNGRILAKRRTEGGTEIAVFLPVERGHE
jgi:two-component system, OmpR family, sensor histidine kinase KdpD